MKTASTYRWLDLLINFWNSESYKYKIFAIIILYKESDKLSVNVLSIAYSTGIAIACWCIVGAAPLMIKVIAYSVLNPLLPHTMKYVCNITN